MLAPPAGSDEVTTSPASSAATHSDVDGQEIAPRGFAPSISATLHPPAPLVGSVDATAFPAQSVATHNDGPGHAIPAKCSLPSTLAIGQADPAAGWVDVSTFPAPSTVTHNDAEGHERAVRPADESILPTACQGTHADADADADASTSMKTRIVRTPIRSKLILIVDPTIMKRNQPPRVASDPPPTASTARHRLWFDRKGAAAKVPRKRLSGRCCVSIEAAVPRVGPGGGESAACSEGSSLDRRVVTAGVRVTSRGAGGVGGCSL